MADTTTTEYGAQRSDGSVVPAVSQIIAAAWKVSDPTIVVVERTHTISDWQPIAQAKEEASSGPTAVRRGHRRSVRGKQRASDPAAPDR